MPFLAAHDLLFLGEKGQAKSRLMRSLVASSTSTSPISTSRAAPFTKTLQADHPEPAGNWCGTRRKSKSRSRGGTARSATPSGWRPGTKFADIIGEIDPARLAAGTSMPPDAPGTSASSQKTAASSHDEVPELDDSFKSAFQHPRRARRANRGLSDPVSDIDVLVLFSPTHHVQRSGKVIPQLKDRIGSLIQTHYPLDARWASRSSSRRRHRPPAE